MLRGRRFLRQYPLPARTRYRPGSNVKQQPRAAASRQMHFRDLAAWFARAVHFVLPSRNFRGRREDRVHAAPAVLCAISGGDAHTSIQVRRKHPGLPCATALRFISCSPRSGRARCHRHRARREPLRNLTPASGRQDHTTSPYASGVYVCHAIRVHRIPPRVRDVRERPSSGGETAGVMQLICPTR